MKAIIMAGGKGNRLRPLTCNIPKPMMPILGKPIMEYTIKLLKKHNIKEIGVTLQYLPDEVINYFGDGKDFGVNISYFVEEKPLGTAGSVKNAEVFLDDTFIVISGDSLTDMDLTAALEYHKEKKSTATIVLKEVAVPLEYGVVVTERDGRINEFLEKPSWSEVFSDNVNTGIYILEPEIFNYYEKEQKFDFSNDLFPILLNNSEPIFGYMTKKYWCDIGNIEQYSKCQIDVLKGIIEVEINGVKIKEGIWIGDNCEVDERVKLTPPVFIGDNTKIYEGAEIGPYSIIGRNNIISNGSTIKRSIIMDFCYIGDNAEIRGAVLSKSVQLESRASVFEQASIGDETIVGSRSIVKPGVKIWPNKVIEDSTVVKANVIWGGKFSKSLFSKNKVTGEINVDITPEFVCKLGSAYGALLKYGARVAISCSDDGAAQMLKYSLATGLLSIGAEVYDLKRVTTSMARFASVFFGVDGSIHVYSDKEEKQNVTIVFMDNNGIDINKIMQRKIENNFTREDFRRVKSDEFKQIIHFSDMQEFYIRSLINKLSIDKIRKLRYRIVLSARNPLLSLTVHKILSEININVKMYNNYKDLYGLSKEVVECGADLGIFIRDEGEDAVIVDQKGRIIKDDMYDALKYFIMLKSSRLKTLVVPVTASEITETVAKICDTKFIRSKISLKEIAEVYLKNEPMLTENEVMNSYLLSLDAIHTLALLINFMATLNTNVEEIISKFPKYFNKKLKICCPWNLKGKVMRNIIEENPSKSIELIEGVKLNYEDAWALILPDADEPYCRLYAEAKNISDVEKLSYELAKRIEDLVSADIVEESTS
ncbi:sugar phosphate nucleotidyltransferase [Clostridium sp. DL1XJH146]